MAAAVNPPGQWTLFWRRFKRDKFALASLIVFLLLVLLCFVGEPLLERVLGHGPNEPFPSAKRRGAAPGGPVDACSRRDEHRRGPRDAQDDAFRPGLGRPARARRVHSDAQGRTESLEIGIGSTFLALLIGVPLGALAGLVGGLTDATVSRFTEFFMGFPILLLLAALGYSVRDRLENVTVHHSFAPGVLSLVLLIGLFSWFYPARIVRSIVLQLRTQEFIDAARMVGASTPRIVRTHIFPHLIGPIAVYFAIICAANIVLESAISFLNIGVPLPDASWGNMLATNWGHFFIIDQPGFTSGIQTTAWTTVFPAAAIALTVLCLALIGEGVREAFDPGSRARAVRL